MRDIITVAAFSLLLTGCAGATYTWEHPDNPGEDRLKTEQAHCDQLAKNERNGFYNHFPHFYHQYQYSYGHFPHTYDQVSYYEEYRTLFRVCMKAKGWEYVKEEKEPTS